jgi:hypothetical protein
MGFETLTLRYACAHNTKHRIGSDNASLEARSHLHLSEVQISLGPLLDVPRMLLLEDYAAMSLRDCLSVRNAL